MNQLPQSAVSSVRKTIQRGVNLTMLDWFDRRPSSREDPLEGVDLEDRVTIMQAQQELARNQRARALAFAPPAQILPAESAPPAPKSITDL